MVKKAKEEELDSAKEEVKPESVKEAVDAERVKAWKHFCDNMEKRDPQRYARMKAAGELDKIPKEFITKI